MHDAHPATAALDNRDPLAGRPLRGEIASGIEAAHRAGDMLRGARISESALDGFSVGYGEAIARVSIGGTRSVPASVLSDGSWDTSVTLLKDEASRR